LIVNRAEMVDIRCHVLRDTGNAVLIEKESVKHWIPLSQVDRITRLNGVSIVRMAAWLAKSRNLI